VGVKGELYIGGEGVGRGYVKRAELTAEKFVPDGFGKKEGGRLYRTGDLAKWRADGRIEFIGRNDNQVKVRGFRIELGEIEGRLAEHERVKETAVVVRMDEGGEKRLVAYYTVAAGKDGEDGVTAEQLRGYLAARLPEYMVPAAYVEMEELPVTVNGKVDRTALPDVEESAYSTREYEAPVGETETVLAGIWADLLHLERVGRHDDFFALGGHSLLAAQAVSRIRQQFEVPLKVIALFEHSILSKFADHVVNLRLEQFDSGEIEDLLRVIRSS
jgi:hypothetical protein